MLSTQQSGHTQSSLVNQSNQFLRCNQWFLGNMENLSSNNELAGKMHSISDGVFIVSLLEATARRLWNWENTICRAYFDIGMIQQNLQTQNPTKHAITCVSFHDISTIFPKQKLHWQCSDRTNPQESPNEIPFESWLVLIVILHHGRIKIPEI